MGLSVRVAASLFAAVSLVACDRPEENARAEEASDPGEVVRQLVASEELILELTPRLKSLTAGLQSGAPLPETARQVLAERVEWRGIDPESRAERSLPELGVEMIAWAGGGGGETLSRDEFLERGLTNPADAAVWEDASLSLVRGQFEGTDRTGFVATVGFQGTATTAGGDLLAAQSQQQVRWERSGGADWQIVAWHMTKIETIRSPARLFEEVLDRAVPELAQLGAVRESMHRRILVDNYFGGKPASLPAGYSDSRFFPDSINVHPAVSVVDIDGDGWDDLYVCVRWGKNQLLRNRGDGTFEEAAERFGLDIDGRNTSATFADFDNDGDPDLMLGRSLERSLYLANVNGRFEPRPEAVATPGLPWLVTSTTAADFNRDGLLDVYFCTYSPLDINTRITGDAAGQAPEWARRFLPAGQAEEVVRRSKEAHSYLGQVGPPNVLIVNRGGGRFEVAPESEMLAGYRNSFQAAWSDYDRDGDPDLYVANDFSPDLLYRNDGGKGFTEVTEEAGLQSMGFAMGASWGDYDNDGHEDLYVSNMYSKAGNRITAQVEGLDPRISASADGNYLFRHEGGASFRRVSGESGEALRVTKAGWSWGGQFADFDNDGFLDLYVSSGFYTPPAEVDIGVDLCSCLWRSVVRSDKSLPDAFSASAAWLTDPVRATRSLPSTRLTYYYGPDYHRHSYSGYERNKLFLNRAGREFLDLSAISGADTEADSRTWSALDYDRDGRADIAVVNANTPLLNLYRNRIGDAAGTRGNLIAIRLVGGSTSAAPSDQSNRDGIGAEVAVTAGDRTMLRVRRGGEGFAAQNSATMLVGIGEAAEASQVVVRWPSGRVSEAGPLPAGDLLVISESAGIVSQESYRVAAP